MEATIVSKDKLQLEEEKKLKILKLFGNVQFIYELALAKLELEAFGVDYRVLNSLRLFQFESASDIETLKRRAAYFERINGEVTDYSQIVKYNRTRSVNQYLTHWVYPYKGKYHPQMIRALLNIIGAKKGDTVLDPFIGSGTTALECMLMGINCIGVDISPVCELISKVKTESIEVTEEIEQIIDELIKVSRKAPSLLNYSLVEYSENSNQKSISKVIDEITNPKVRNFYKVAELIAHSDLSRRGRDFYKSFEENAKMMLASVKDLKEVSQKLNLSLGEVNIERGDSRSLDIDDESIDGIITSPPYSIALDYVKNDAHALTALGYNLEKVREEFVGVRGTGPKRVELYNKDMKESFEEMNRVLKEGGYCVVVIGNAMYQGGEIKTVEMTTDYCEEIGLKLVKNIDKIIFGLYNVMQRENILIFQKGG